MSKDPRSEVFRRRALFGLKPAKKKQLLPIMLVWKDGERTAARVDRLELEVACGTSRFRQDAGDPALYNEI